jgi:hypothetical protein
MGRWGLTRALGDGQLADKVGGGLGMLLIGRRDVAGCGESSGRHRVEGWLIVFLRVNHREAIPGLSCRLRVCLNFPSLVRPACSLIRAPEQLYRTHTATGSPIEQI